MELDSGQRLCVILADRFEQITHLLAEHRADSREALPHAVFWDYTRAVVASYLERPPHVPWSEFLVVLADNYEQGDGYVRGIVEVSFLENLPLPTQEGYGIVRSLPAPLRTAFDRVRPRG
jgi:hypothetical protein